MSHSSCILSFVLIDENQNERFYVTEIVFAAHIRSPFFRRERSNDVKYISLLNTSYLLNSPSLTPMIKWRLLDHL